MYIYTNFRIICFMIAALLLSACSDSNRERLLQEEIKNIKISAASEQKKITGDIFELPTPVTYPPNTSGIPSAVSRITNSANPLQNYPLKALRFTGTITRGNQILAYILTPDNMVYPVKVGDSIGNESGKIIKIDPTNVDVSIKVAIPGQPPTDQIVSLQIKE